MLLFEQRFLLIPSSRKQKPKETKENRSRQSDVMSDLENIDVLFGVYAKN